MKNLLVHLLLASAVVAIGYVAWRYYFDGDMMIVAKGLLVIIWANAVGHGAMAFNESMDMLRNPPKRDEHEPEVSPVGLWWRRAPHLRSLVLALSLVGAVRYLNGMQAMITVLVMWAFANMLMWLFGEIADNAPVKPAQVPIE